MDEEVKVVEYDANDFLKPRCPVKVGDMFYRNYKVPNTLNRILVEKVEEAKDENGLYYLITGRAINMAVGINVRKYDSRLLINGDYTILKKGASF